MKRAKNRVNKVAPEEFDKVLDEVLKNKSNGTDNVSFENKKNKDLEVKNERLDSASKDYIVRKTQNGKTRRNNY